MAALPPGPGDGVLVQTLRFHRQAVRATHVTADKLLSRLSTVPHVSPF